MKLQIAKRILILGIFAELPSARATRSLTLVAKTLQTLANFTRFQGKENFMEFLNDFLEEEAPHMNEFLLKISTRNDQPPPDSIHNWSGYIDQGKQLSILHHLLSESIQKLPPNRQNELSSLRNILDAISRSKTHNGSLSTLQSLSPQPLSHSSQSSINNSNNQESAYQANSISLIGGGERGIIRGVLTPSSLERNIFRYNDPTVSILVNNLQSSTPNQSRNNVNHPNGHPYTSSTSLASNGNGGTGATYHSFVDHHHHANPVVVTQAPFMHSAVGKSRSQLPHPHSHHHHLQNPILQQKSINYSTDSLPSTPRNFNTLSSYHSTTASAAPGGKSTTPVTRASTLPRNNHPSTIVNINRGDNEPPAVATSTNFIQIGVDTSSAFSRKSPTPLYKSYMSGSASGLPQRTSAHESQLSSNGSLRSNDERQLGDDSPDFNNLRQYLNQQDRRGAANAHGNMPMKIEDLDDLLNYADEQAARERDARANNNNELSDNLRNRTPSPSDKHDAVTATQTATKSPDAFDEFTNKSYVANHNNNNNISNSNNNNNNSKQLQSTILQYLSGKYSNNNNAVGNHININHSNNVYNNNNGNYSLDGGANNNKYVNGLNSLNTVAVNQSIKNAATPQAGNNAAVVVDAFMVGAGGMGTNPKRHRSSHKTASISSSSSDEGVIGHNLMCCGVTPANHHRLASQANGNGGHNGHSRLNGTLSSSSHGSAASEKDHLLSTGTNEYGNILSNVGKSSRRLEDTPNQANRNNSSLQVSNGAVAGAQAKGLSDNQNDRKIITSHVYF